MPNLARKYVWDQLEEDTPVPLLHRRRVVGERVLVAWIELDKGCTVDLHEHHNEQISIILSGSLKFFVGRDPTEEVIVAAGEVLHLPSNTPHGAEALEDTVAIDLISPPGEMGVDRQGVLEGEG